MDIKEQEVRKTKLLIENHIHGAYGVDFLNSSVDEILYVSELLLKHGVGGYFPTLATDSVDNIKRQIEIIKKAKTLQNEEMAEILGVHLEGIFMNPLKRGIQDENLFLTPNIENYKLFEDDIIKIVTLAPELDGGLISYLKEKGVKVQAGHCLSSDLSNVDGVTHIFNAMGSINHRESSTTLSSLVNDDIYVEVIMDLVHLNKDTLELIFRAKPQDKILPISDCLPIAYDSKSQMEFCNKTIYYDGEKITSKDGTMAGSSLLLNDILKRLNENGIDGFKYVENLYKYHDVEIEGCIYWGEDGEIIVVEKGKTVIYKE